MTIIINSTVNKLIYIPKVNTTTYGIDSIRYQCATLWNKFFKKGEIKVDDDKKNNMKLSKIKNKKSIFSTLTLLYQPLFSTETLFVLCVSHLDASSMFHFAFSTISYLILFCYLNNSGTLRLSYLYPPHPPPTHPQPLTLFSFFHFEIMRQKDVNESWLLVHLLSRYIS